MAALLGAHRLGPHHLVVRRPELELAGARRRPARGDDRRRRHRRPQRPGHRRQGPHPGAHLAAHRVRRWRSSSCSRSTGSSRRPSASRWLARSAGCRSVSAAYMAFAHGSNDAQKTMGIITLALFSAGVIPTDRRAALGHRRVGHRALARDRRRRLADHAHDGPARRRARAHPRLRGRDDRRHRPRRHRPLRDAGLDDPCHLERDHGRRLCPRAPRASAGASPGASSLAWVITLPASGTIAAARLVRPQRHRGPVMSPSHRPHRAPGGTAMTFRLLPKDVRFFDLFVADGENLQAAAAPARRDGRRPTTGSTSGSPRSRRSRSAATRSTGRSSQRARGRLHHPVRPRGHPRAHGHASMTWSTASRRPPRRS